MTLKDYLNSNDRFAAGYTGRNPIPFEGLQ